MAYGTFEVVDIVFYWLQIKMQYYQLIYLKSVRISGSVSGMSQSFKKPWLSAFKKKL